MLVMYRGMQKSGIIVPFHGWGARPEDWPTYRRQIVGTMLNGKLHWHKPHLMPEWENPFAQWQEPTK